MSQHISFNERLMKLGENPHLRNITLSLNGLAPLLTPKGTDSAESPFEALVFDNFYHETFQ